MRILFIVFILIFLNQNLFSQSSKSDSSLKKYSGKISFDTNKIKEATLLSNTSDIFSYDSLYIWSDKRTLSEIMNERSGFFINDFGLGGRNLINYNGYSPNEVAVFRDGIQVNDILFGGFDVQNISVNEIDKIEEVSNVSSFLYGTGSNAKSINVITKDVFQSKPFSQFRYSQDRYNSLFADVVFNLPFSRKVSWMAGATKHSIDGRYVNSEFDVWNARTRLDYFFSPTFNLRLNFYYDNIKRGLNEGLLFTADETVLESNTAAVVNPVSDENVENFFYNATLTGRFFKDKTSLTKLMLYSNNTTRQYNNIDTIIFGGNPFFSPPANYQYIQYAADLKQNVNFRFSRSANLDLLIGGNAYMNYFNLNPYFFRDLNENGYSLLFKTDFQYENLFLSAFGNLDHSKKFQNSQTVSGEEDFTDFNYGTEGSYKFIFNRKSSFKIFAGVNNIQEGNILLVSPLSYIHLAEQRTATYYEAGFDLNIAGIFKLNSYYFNNYSALQNYSYSYSPEGINTSVSFFSKYFDSYINYNYLNTNFFPSDFIKADLAYHNYLFNSKLNLRTGFIIKYFTAPAEFYQYSQSRYSFYPYSREIDQDGFQIDYYLGARIGHANINLTVANIFNMFYYDTYLYPADDRGGLLNAISRFTIVWDFLN